MAGGAPEASLFPDLLEAERQAARAVAQDRHPEAPGAWLAAVAVKVPQDRGIFDYRVPLGLRERIQVGQRVRVPFAGRKLTGYVVELPKSSEVPESKLRELDGLLDEDPVFNLEMLELCHWLARYYQSSLAEVLEVALPQSVIREWKKRKELSRESLVEPASGPGQGKAGPAGKKVLALLAERPEGASIEALENEAGISRAVLRRLLEKGWLKLRAPTIQNQPEAVESPPELNPEQAEAVGALCKALDERRFQATLLYGITGSGKTEVYLRSIEHVLASGRGAIVLVPEIALTPQTTRRFKARFGDKVAVLHSALSDKERWTAWQRVRKGEARVVIGPRSALFAPVSELALIVVDEEHETTYKQERSPRYQARDVAVLRAQRLNAVVLLGSATPSLESYQKAIQGRYQMLKLGLRAGGGQLPPVEIVDMGVEWREVKGAPLISRLLRRVINEALGRGERAILFLNRRGFTTVLLCAHCGYVHKCQFCDVSMTYHKKEDRVLCHFCADNSPAPRGPCPSCQGPPLKHRGAGTERIEEICQSVFPIAKIERVDSDTVRSGDSVEVRLDRFRRGDVNLLIGTQMIARGLDIPEVTAVGIINADTSLGHPDFRATERTFQLIAQVAGRAGRGELPGRTVVQTFNPGEPAILAAAKHDFESFANSELRARELLGYPPFGRLLHILVRGEKQELVESEIERLAQELRAQLPPGCAFLGPAISPRAYLANKFRYQALIKGPDAPAIQRVMDLAGEFQSAHGVEVVLDRDPMFML
jgi:primosomal protein N' (replication factor Y)